MSTKQPIWKTLHTLGDLGCIYADETSVYPPELEIWDEYEPELREKFSDDECNSFDDVRDDWCRATRAQHRREAGGTGEEVTTKACDSFTVDRHNRKRFKVYRVVLDQLDRRQLPDGSSTVDEWFGDDLDSVASSAGTTRQALVDDLCSDDPVKRWGAYYSVGSHFGWDNFDSEPLDLSERELQAREDRQSTAQKQRRQRITRAATAPHARCADSTTCAEHAHDKRVPSCKEPDPSSQSRTKGRRLP